MDKYILTEYLNQTDNNTTTTYTNDTFKVPPPTKSELILRKILRSKKIPIKEGQAIWYTSCDQYTPDLIVGKRLIIEVDGKIHDQTFRIAPDRIRQRALENMGYVVYRVRNDEIYKSPNLIAEQIIEKYFEIIAADDSQGSSSSRSRSSSDSASLTDGTTPSSSSPHPPPPHPSSFINSLPRSKGRRHDDKKPFPKILQLEKPLKYDPIPKHIGKNLDYWAASFNLTLREKPEDEGWTAEFFKQVLLEYDAQLVANQCAMERLILLLLGLNLRRRRREEENDDMLDWEYSAALLEKGIDIVQTLFRSKAEEGVGGKGGGEEEEEAEREEKEAEEEEEDKTGTMTGIHLKNMFNISAPGFFKNLIFQGGPNINLGIVKIKDIEMLKASIEDFNTHFAKFGITVDISDIKNECLGTLRKMDNIKATAYSWLLTDL